MNCTIRALGRIGDVHSTVYAHGPVYTIEGASYNTLLRSLPNACIAHHLLKTILYNKHNLMHSCTIR